VQSEGLCFIFYCIQDLTASGKKHNNSSYSSHIIPKDMKLWKKKYPAVDLEKNPLSIG
jgi:hypothetical protein